VPRPLDPEVRTSFGRVGRSLSWAAGCCARGVRRVGIVMS